MPDGATPGPGGPGCAVPIGGAAPWDPAEDLVAVSQPAVIDRVVAMEERPDTLAREGTTTRAGAPLPPLPSSLAAGRRPIGATTAGPHVHERWGESRKLELSYCINGMPGEDAVLEANYHKTIRALHSTMAEWERVTGANFVHVVADDTPELTAHVVIQENLQFARPDCKPGTNAYFGVFGHNSGLTQGVANATPQAWNDPALDPLGGGVLARSVLLNSNIIASVGNATLLLVLRHELGHMMGFIHEEANLEVDDDCTEPDPRPVTPLDSTSVMGTPDCLGLADAHHLSHRDRLSAFFLHHTPRARFETSTPSTGYRYSGVIASGAEILWHSEGSTEGVLWRPQLGDDGVTFVAEPFPYSSPVPPPPGGWYPNESEVVIPLQLTDDPGTFDLLFHGPGPDVADLAVLNSGTATSVVPYPNDAFSVPVVGRFDADDLGRDVVYLYQPGSQDSVALAASGDGFAVVTDVPQQPGFAYPLAAPYRGPGFPDDIVWLDPQQAEVETWRLGAGVMTLAAASSSSQGALGLANGENIPAIGDFNGDGRADIMWHGVANLPAGLPEIVDVLWLSQSTATELQFATVPKQVGHSYRPFVGDFDADGIDDIFWHRSGGLTSLGPSAWHTGPSFVWYFDSTGGHEAKPFAVGGDHSPYVGDFDGDGCHDIAWFDSVADSLHVWRCLPGTRDFDCGVTASTPPNAAPVGMHWGF